MVENRRPHGAATARRSAGQMASQRKSVLAGNRKKQKRAQKRRALRVGLERSNLKVTTFSAPEQESHAGVCSPRGTCIKFSSSPWRDAYSTLWLQSQSSGARKASQNAAPCDSGSPERCVARQMARGLRTSSI